MKQTDREKRDRAYIRRGTIIGALGGGLLGALMYFVLPNDCAPCNCGEAERELARQLAERAEILKQQADTLHARADTLKVRWKQFHDQQERAAQIEKDWLRALRRASQ